MHLHFLGSIFDKRHRSKLRHALLCGPHEPQHKPTLDLIGRVKRDDKTKCRGCEPEAPGKLEDLE